MFGKCISKRALTLILVLPLWTAGCGSERADNGTDERGVLSDPGSVKADGTNSCKGMCGKKALSGCWCDTACVTFADCCADKQVVCGGPGPAPSCDGVKCGAGYHCEMKGINGGNVPVCIKDAVVTKTCQDLGGYCLPLTSPMGQCKSGETTDNTPGLCSALPGQSATCCLKTQPQTCADLKCGAGYHCEMKGINGGSVPVCIKDAAQGSCLGSCGSQAPGGCWCDKQCSKYGDCCPDKSSVCDQAQKRCQDLGGYCLPLTFPMGQCKAGENTDNTLGLCGSFAGESTTCCVK